MGMRVGFVGIGTMGRPMAMNLVRAGHRLTVHDVVPGAVRPLVDAGAVAADSAAQAARDAEVVVTMLPASMHVEEAYFGPAGVLEAIGPGTVVVDMSTIDPGTARRVAAAVAERGGVALDAPVSGSSVGAEAGTLTIMCGGDAEALARVRPLLEAMGRNIVHCGGSGMGQAVKLCNNLVAGAAVAAVGEAFALASSLGVEPQVLYDVMSTSSGNCWALQTRPPVPGLVDAAPSNVGFAPGFMVDLMLKDLGLVLTAAGDSGLALDVAGAARDAYAAASERGLGRLDFSAVYRSIKGEA